MTGFSVGTCFEQEGLATLIKRPTQMVALLWLILLDTILRDLSSLVALIGLQEYEEKHAPPLWIPTDRANKTLGLSTKLTSQASSTSKSLPRER